MAWLTARGTSVPSHHDPRGSAPTTTLKLSTFKAKLGPGPGAAQERRQAALGAGRDEAWCPHLYNRINHTSPGSQRRQKT